MRWLFVKKEKSLFTAIKIWVHTAPTGQEPHYKRLKWNNWHEKLLQWICLLFGGGQLGPGQATVSNFSIVWSCLGILSELSDTQRVLSKRGFSLWEAGKLFTNYLGLFSRDQVLCKRSPLKRDQLLSNLLIQILKLCPQHQI